MKVNVGGGETSGAADVADAALWSTMALNSRQSAYDTLAAVKADGPNDGNFHYASMTTEVAGWVITQSRRRALRATGERPAVVEARLAGRHCRAGRSDGQSVRQHGSDDLGARPRQTGPDDRRSRQGRRPASLPVECHRPPLRIWRCARLAERKFQEHDGLSSYRSYWYQLAGDDHALMGLGVFGQGLYINPTTRVVMVRFSSLPAHTVIEYSKGWDEIRIWLDRTAMASR